MPIIAKDTGGGKEFTPAPGGVHAAVCCDVVDLGVLEVIYSGKTKKQHKIRIVWQIEQNMEDGKPFIVQKRYTLSLHEKAALRADLESWRSKPFTEDELHGFDVESVIGAPALLNVVPEMKDGKVYANIKSLMRLPKTGFTVLTPRDYIRAKDRDPKHDTNDAPPFAEGITDDDVPF